MALSARHSRASSVPSSPTRLPAKLSTPVSTPTRSATTTATTTGATTTSTASTILNRAPTATDVASRASLLQPRVAVVLNVPSPWHPWLFALRLCSILPAIWWGTPSALHLLLRLLEISIKRKHGGPNSASYAEDDSTIPLTETALAVIWCFASGYLSFFFTDCLMSRWLLNYTPQATIVRLLTINAVNAYVTLTVLSLAGGFHDPRLLLPGWVGIATTLTVAYHITHQKINIRKETSTSVNVFSIASYISMVTLLANMHAYQPGYPAIPVLVRAQHAWDEIRRMTTQIRATLEQYRDL